MRGVVLSGKVVGLMKVGELDTPALVVDLDQMERNIAEMAAQVGAAGARVRPHTKTHKTPESRAAATGAWRDRYHCRQAGRGRSDGRRGV